MKPLRVLTTQGSSAVLRALFTVAIADGELDPRELRYLEMHRDLAGGRIDDLVPIMPEEVAASIQDPEARAGLIQRMVIMTMLDEKVDLAEIARLRAFASALGVDEPAICQMQAFQKGRIRLLAFDLVRRGFIGKQLRRVWAEHGLRGVLAAANSMRGRADQAVAARHVSLGSLPPGTLGRGFFDHCRSNGYPLPGEEGGAPEMLLFHDLGHVLTGYGTDPSGEVQMAGFEAGYMGEDGFGVVLLALFLFHLGAELPRTGPARGKFDLDAFDAAFERGRSLAVDLRRWDVWPRMAETVESLRRELGLARA
jgi:hypothetical protein